MIRKFSINERFPKLKKKHRKKRCGKLRVIFQYFRGTQQKEASVLL